MKIKVMLNEDTPMPSLIKKGDWIDLCAAETVSLKAPQAGIQYQADNVKYRDVSFYSALISLGVAMQLPKGFEAVIVPRSSLFKKRGVIQANGMGVIDNSYCGNDDVWKFPAIALEHTTIEKGDRICQFRIQLSQMATFWQKLKWLFSSHIKLVPTTFLCNQSRDGFGSTGIN